MKEEKRIIRYLGKRKERTQMKQKTNKADQLECHYI